MSMNEILLSGLCKCFSEKPVLDRIDLAARQGDIWKISGASGSGKTTLLRILLGLETADSGRVQIPQSIRFSAVFQEDRLCPWLTAWENIALVLPKRGNAETARAVAAEIFPSERFCGYPAELSGGQLRRVALARAVVATSDALVLDEPFTGLDTIAAEDAAAFVLRHRAGRTVFYASHTGGVVSPEEKTLFLKQLP